MDIIMEKKIAKAFIYANKQDRFLFEMSKNQRLHAICRLPFMIDKSSGLMLNTQFPSPAEIVKIMQAQHVKDMCYVISEYENDGFDGEYVPLIKAAEKLNTNGFPSLIVGLPSGFSHFKEESYASNQPNCFLKPRIRFDGIPWT